MSNAGQTQVASYKLFTPCSWKFHDTHFDIVSCDAKPRALVFDWVHRLNCKSPALHFLDIGLLVGDRLHEELAAHVRVVADVVERLHCFAVVRRGHDSGG